nr:response regulator transcription factor [uncultured Sellimonas sp.]
MFQILVTDDDKNIRRYLCAVLTAAGYKTRSAASAMEALKLMEEYTPDLLILDIMMPGMDGYALTNLLRECHSDLPILMLTAKQLPENIKQGFLVGTDDYMTKPVDEEEMLLRIKALLRRSRIVHEQKLSIGNTILDYKTRTVYEDGKEYQLPQKEFSLLFKLLSYPNQIFTRLQLLEDVWGTRSESTESTVSVHINRLRKRFENNKDFSIVTLRGLGYKAQIQEDQ